MILKHGEVHPYRMKLLESQNGKCPICGGEIDSNDAVLDHDHNTGSWKRTADKYGISHRRLLAYATKARSITELA